METKITVETNADATGICINEGKGKIDKRVYIVLTLLLGVVGGHHFYSGHWVVGLLYLLFCWTYIPCILALVDLIVGLCRPADSKYKYVSSPWLFA